MPIDLSRLGQDKLFLVLSAAERLRQNNTRIIMTLIDRGYRVVVITTNQPSGILEESLRCRGDRSRQGPVHRHHHEVRHRADPGRGG